MYLPDAFAVTDSAEIDALLRRTPFGSLITTGPRGLFASHLPFIHDPKDGVLAGHLARANPHRSLAGDGQAMVIFQGSNAYVTPNWYPSKAEHGRVVPTWNYEVAHAYGRICWRDDADWLRANVQALTERFEADQPKPWAVTDASAEHIDRLIATIVGVEFRIERIEAKRKLSQNRSSADREGVVAGLSTGTAQDVAVANAMRAVTGPGEGMG
jgi:transcriptional regulator